ncbi:MAG TPA: DinB family protein [Acidimicrobiales bacterium]|nr:DinB family protein [Acidimicrobiales bacterium]
MSIPAGGIDPETINPPDAIAALRSFPRRWRSALALVADDPSASELVRRRTGDSWSALEHASYTAELLESTREHVLRTRREERPNLIGPTGPSGHQGSEDDALDTALAAIGQHAPALADALDELPAEDWRRSATVDGGETTILSMARRSVAESANHLRAAEQALHAGRGTR